MDSGHWDVSIVGEFDPDQFFGFIYEIEELATGRSYLGKKFFRFKRQATKSNSSRTKESDWKVYTGSCVPLNDAIDEHGKDAFAFRILSLCVGRCQLTYEEQQIQFSRDVLRAKLPNGQRKYWNRTIGHLLFSGIEKQTEEAKRKISEANTGRQTWLGKHHREETKEKIAAAHIGMTASAETRQKISDVQKGKVISDDTRRKQSRAMTGTHQTPEQIAMRVESRRKTLAAKKALLTNGSAFS
jgi:hypothetical protein